MEKATISELKNRLSAYLDKVRAGHTVVIFDRSQPIARIERVEGSETASDRLVRLERAGLVRRARHPLSMPAIRDMASPTRQSVLQALLEERGEGR